MPKKSPFDQTAVILLSPDGIPITGQPNTSVANIVKEALEFQNQYRKQGYYKDAYGNFFQVDAILHYMTVAAIDEEESCPETVGTPDSTDARSRLIAAAPELLEFAKNILEAFVENEDGDLNDIPASEVIDMARAVIAKATIP